MTWRGLASDAVIEIVEEPGRTWENKGEALAEAKRVNEKALALFKAIREGEKPHDRLEEAKGYIIEAGQLMQEAGLKTTDWEAWLALPPEEAKDKLLDEYAALVDRLIERFENSLVIVG